MNNLSHTAALSCSGLRRLGMVLVLMTIPSVVLCDDWMTWTSTYTHDPSTGQRVDQFALAEQPYGPSRSAVQRSGYRHYRSSLQVGQTADNIHIVEQWGKQVIPYEQWRFPYRPYGAPYDAWGPQAPYGIFNGQLNGFGNGNGYGGNGYGGNGYGGNGYGGTGNPYPANSPGNYGTVPAMGGYGPSRGFPLQPEYRNQPWFDGTYPDAPPLRSQ